MATRVTMHQAKTDLSRLVAMAEQGEEVIIMRAHKPVARLVPIHEKRVPGFARCLIHLSDDFDAPLPDDILQTFDT